MIQEILQQSKSVTTFLNKEHTLIFMILKLLYIAYHMSYKVCLRNEKSLTLEINLCKEDQTNRKSIRSSKGKLCHNNLNLMGLV